MELFFGMQQYLDLLSHVLKHGNRREDRTGTGTLSIFGWQMRFDLSDGFPLLTTKKLHTHSIIHELIWFISGDTNIRYLRDNKVRIWDEWADEKGTLALFMDNNGVNGSRPMMDKKLTSSIMLLSKSKAIQNQDV